MSTSLYWSRVPIEPKENDIGYLKRVLARNIWDTDGSCSESEEIVDEGLIPFLEGVVAGNCDGDMALDAKELIEAIRKYKQVHLCLHS